METPSFVAAYKDVAALGVREIDSKIAFRLYDTFGIDEDSISKLAKALEIKFNLEKLLVELENARYRSKKASTQKDDNLYLQLVNEKLPVTDDSFKYFYLKDGNDQYVFKDVDIKLLKIYANEESVETVPSGHYCTLLLDKTNLYSEAGGQVGTK